jgi:hypothetical protein
MAVSGRPQPPSYRAGRGSLISGAWLCPQQSARFRARHSVSGVKSDAGDAHVLADMVRADSHQLREAAGDSPEAAGIKVLARTHKTMIWERVRECSGCARAGPRSAADPRRCPPRSSTPGAGTLPAGPLSSILAALRGEQRGAATTLSAAAGGGTAVLIFYRGAWCPYCNIALSAYQTQLLPQLAGRGIRLIAVSPQKPDGSLTMQQKNDLAFAVVSDPGNAIAARLGILTRPPHEARAAQLQLGLDLASVKADHRHPADARHRHPRRRPHRPLGRRPTRLQHPHRI